LFVIAGIIALLAARSALAATTGPVYPVPGVAGVGHGGSTCAAASNVEGQSGKGFGQTWTFGGGGMAPSGTDCPYSLAVPPPFDTTRFQSLYWGSDSSSTAKRPALSLDGAIDTASETLNFDAAASDLTVGRLVWTGQTTMTWCQPVGCSAYNGPTPTDTRFTLLIRDMADAPVALTSPGAVGIPAPAEVGGVVSVTPSLTNFKAHLLFEARDPVSLSFVPALDMYNTYNHPPGGDPQTLMSFTGGFWYVDRPPVAAFSFSPPTPTSSQQVSFDASASADPDGTIASYSWDLNGDNVFGDATGPTAQTSFAAGDHAVSVLVTDDEGSTNVATHTVTVASSTGPPQATPPPGTTIQKAKIKPDAGSAKFTFAATGEASAFECALAKKKKPPRFAPCTSPKKYKNLKPGKYTFEVAAIGPGGTDSSPAKKKFRI
jgi:PKD domain